jgi:hypothetical protein
MVLYLGLVPDSVESSPSISMMQEPNIGEGPGRVKHGP